MSPYGSTPTKPPKDILASTAYSNNVDSITVHHVNKDTCPKDLLGVLFEEFEKELEIGRTYPQEGPIGLDGFRDYFFHGDVFVGIIASPDSSDASTPYSIEAAQVGRDWSDCVAGSYYVRPNLA